MMATAAVVGFSAGKRVLSSSFYYSELNDKFSFVNDIGIAQQYATSMKNTINAKKSSASYKSFPSNRHNQSIKALKEHVDTSSTAEPWFQTLDQQEDENVDPEYSVEALLLLQKSMLEKQWSLNFEEIVFSGAQKRKTYKIRVTSSGVSARQRRMHTRRRDVCQNSPVVQPNVGKQLRSIISPKLHQNRTRGYAKGVASEELLSHKEVIRLSKKIKTGLSLQEHKSRLMERLGFEPSDEQLSMSLKISRAELKSRLVEYSLARERLAMSNVRLVMSVAQRYVNMGAEMGDLVQGGLIGLLRGIEKFDSSKGFKMSTYVYWWIRQGVSRVLVENSRTLRLPAHLHERLSLIRNAKLRLQDQRITPTVDKIAECLKISEKKVTNATEAVSKVFSLDREAFPSVDGLPGASLHSYIADNRPENNPWNGVDDWALKEEVNNLINTTLGLRERDIVRLYYGLDHECLTWEDISKRIGLSRERVRQVGLVAVEKLKHAAMKRNLEAMLVKQ